MDARDGMKETAGRNWPLGLQPGRRAGYGKSRTGGNMAERKGWRSIPKKTEDGVGAGIKQGLTVVAKAIITSAGLAGLRWV